MAKEISRKVREYQEDGSFIDRDMTEAELAQSALDAQEIAAAEAALLAKISASESAISKLEAIGLTSEEIAALKA